MAGQAWTQEERDALKALAEKGYTAQEIAESGVFQRSLAAIVSQAVQMGVSLAGLKKEINKEAFRRMMEAR